VTLTHDPGIQHGSPQTLTCEAVGWA
jgi:hypothetical protein